MKIPRIAAGAVALASLLSLAAAHPARGADRADDWRVIAQRALDRVDVLTATGTHRAFTLAFAAQATAWLSPDGWQDPDALAYLDRLYATQNPDGGYGLGYAYDAHGDGTMNPATTTYVVSLAGHVGPPLLDALRAGVPGMRPRVQQLLDLIATAPQINTAAGRCLAYSRNANDAKAGLCVHNVNAGAAAFMLEAGRDGFAVPWWLIQAITKRELSAYNAGTRFWPYRDNMAPDPQDAAHNAYTIESVYPLAYPVGYSSAYVAMSAGMDDDPNTALVGMMLAALPPAPTAMSGNTTVWCVLGDQWTDEATAFTTASWNDVVRLAQVAYYASRASKACEA